MPSPPFVRPSVHLSVLHSVSALTFEPNDLWPWHSASVWVMTAALLRLKDKVRGQGQTSKVKGRNCATLPQPRTTNPLPTMGRRSTLHIRHSETHFTFHATSSRSNRNKLVEMASPSPPLLKRWEIVLSTPPPRIDDPTATGRIRR